VTNRFTFEEYKLTFREQAAKIRALELSNIEKERELFIN